MTNKVNVNLFLVFRILKHRGVHWIPNLLCISFAKYRSCHRRKGNCHWWTFIDIHVVRMQRFKDAFYSILGCCLVSPTVALCYIVATQKFTKNHEVRSPKITKKCFISHGDLWWLIMIKHDSKIPVERGSHPGVIWSHKSTINLSNFNIIYLRVFFISFSMILYSKLVWPCSYFTVHCRKTG